MSLEQSEDLVADLVVIDEPQRDIDPSRMELVDRIELHAEEINQSIRLHGSRCHPHLVVMFVLTCFPQEGQDLQDGEYQ